MTDEPVTEIAIIDYGVGNLRSVEKAFRAAGAVAVISEDERVLREARALVLPGVGAFGACMSALRERGFDVLVSERAADRIPILGVCVGMQMLFEESEEFGSNTGLGLLKGRVRRFDDRLIVPHVGWNQVEARREHPILSGVKDQTFFYFVHSYYCEVADAEDVVGVTSYGVSYASIVARRAICGVQFHPEKSQSAGLRLLRNFAQSASRMG